MPKTNVGDRVGAILSSDDKKVYFLGYGVYEGDVIPEEGIGGTVGILRKFKRKNPAIKLDNSQRVYGAECWFGPEEWVKKQLEGREMVMVDIAECRKEYLDMGMKATEAEKEEVVH